MIEIKNAGDQLPLGNFTYHSGFESITNLMNDAGEMIFITSDETKSGPSTIVITPRNLQEIRLAVIEKGTIRIGDKTFKTALVNRFDSSLTIDKKQASLVEKRLHKIVTDASLFNEKSLGFLFHPDMERHFSGSFDRHYVQQVKKAFDLMIHQKIVQGVQMIKGTGYGLTPSGDDFIAGLLYGIHFNEQKFDKNLQGLKWLIFNAAQSNNSLVNTFLKHAVQSRYFYTLKKILFLLSGENEPAIPELSETIFSHGHTSGADLFSGYITSVIYKLGL